MKSKLLHEREGERTLAVIFEIDDEVSQGLLDLAREYSLRGSHFTGIGAFRDVVLGYWVWERKDYESISIREQVEVVSLVGNIALAPDGSPKVHAHVVVAKRDGTAYGGHLLEAHVRPTLEVIVTEEPEYLQRYYDERTGLALIAPAAS